MVLGMFWSRRKDLLPLPSMVSYIIMVSNNGINITPIIVNVELLAPLLLVHMQKCSRRALIPSHVDGFINDIAWIFINDNIEIINVNAVHRDVVNQMLRRVRAYLSFKALMWHGSR